MLEPRSASASHGLGTQALRSFLLLTADLAEAEVELDAVAIDQIRLDHATVSLEYPLLSGGVARRLDVLVTVPEGELERPVLLVEYKVDASETDGQTAAYAEWGMAQAKKGSWPVPLMVYLCPALHGGQEPAAPFEVVDYDAYCPWLMGLRTGELSDRGSGSQREQGPVGGSEC